MKVDVSEATAQLRQIACVAPEPAEGTEPPLTHLTVRLGACKYTLRVASSPAGIRDRADRLEKTARAAARLGTYRTPCKTSTRAPKRAKFSKVVAQQFLDDGEQENHQNYCELYA